jgi:hypothetical protein
MVGVGVELTAADACCDVITRYENAARIKLTTSTSANTIEELVLIFLNGFTFCYMPLYFNFPGYQYSYLADYNHCRAWLKVAPDLKL